MPNTNRSGNTGLKGLSGRSVKLLHYDLYALLISALLLYIVVVVVNQCINPVENIAMIVFSFAAELCFYIYALLLYTVYALLIRTSCSLIRKVKGIITR